LLLRPILQSFLYIEDSERQEDGTKIQPDGKVRHVPFRSRNGVCQDVGEVKEMVKKIQESLAGQWGHDHDLEGTR
jgi:hypothetical protein